MRHRRTIQDETRKRRKAQRVVRPACALCDCAFRTYLQTTEV